VRIRSKRSFMEREALVWRGLEESEPTGVRFVGPRAVEVLDRDGCTYRSTFTGGALDVRPVHIRSYDEPGC
jgi:hypothetical protein